MEETNTGMTRNVIDFFKIGGDRELVATLVDAKLQDGATLEFLEFWRCRPRELMYQVEDPEPDFDGCVLPASTTLENDPRGYIEALNAWLFEHGYTFQGRRSRG